MTPKEKWQRMTNPQSPEDYGIKLTSSELSELASQEPELFAEEVAPYLPETVVQEIMKCKKSPIDSTAK